MNNKDRRYLAYLLSSSTHIEEFKQRLFLYDERLLEEYEEYEHFNGRNEEVTDLLAKKMEEENGYDWSLKNKDSYARPIREVIEECRKEVYGDDYHPSLFK